MIVNPIGGGGGADVVKHADVIGFSVSGNTLTLLFSYDCKVGQLLSVYLNSDNYTGVSPAPSTKYDSYFSAHVNANGIPLCTALLYNLASNTVTAAVSGGSGDSVAGGDGYATITIASVSSLWSKLQDRLYVGRISYIEA